MVLVNSQIAIKCQVGNKIDIYFGTLKGFVVKKRHISCMESCYSDIYWLVEVHPMAQSSRQKIWSTASHLSMRNQCQFYCLTSRHSRNATNFIPGLGRPCPAAPSSFQQHAQKDRLRLLTENPHPRPPSVAPRRRRPLPPSARQSPGVWVGIQ